MFTTIISTIWAQLSGVHILLAAICLTLLAFKTTREGVTGKPRYRRGKRGEGYISGVSRKDWDDYSNWKKEQKQKEIDFIVNGSGKANHGGHIWATPPGPPAQPEKETKQKISYVSQRNIPNNLYPREHPSNISYANVKDELPF